MQYVYNSQGLEEYAQWTFFESAFSPEECTTIKNLLLNPSMGTVSKGVRDDSIRVSEIDWLPFSEDTRWIYERIHSFVYSTNDIRYKFDLVGMSEPFQLSRYIVGGHYNWHQDFSLGTSLRKLSISLQLDESDAYSGGDLEFIGYNDKVQRNIGDLIIFPSFNTHRITPITSGVRHSLVGWISGLHSFR